MATVVNAADSILQAAASRYQSASVPSLSIDYGAISGTKPPSNADNTQAAFVNGIGWNLLNVSIMVWLLLRSRQQSASPLRV